MMKIELEKCGLIILVTLGCNAACGHCLYECCPSKAKVRFSETQMKNILFDARESGIWRVCFSGGEPMLFPRTLFNCILDAKAIGYSHISIRTNGFWAINEKTTEKVMWILQNLGLNQIGLSYDYYHAPSIPVDNVKRIIKIAEQIGIEVWLDWVGANKGKDVWGILGEHVKLLRISPQPSCRIGRARTLPHDHFSWFNLEQIEFESPFSFSCGDSENLFVEVYPTGYARLHSCCLSNPRLLMKTTFEGDWIKGLVLRVKADPAIEFLHRYGVGGLIRKAKVECPEALRSYYTSSCEACWQLLPLLFPVSAEENNELLPFGQNGHTPSLKQFQLVTTGMTRKVSNATKEFIVEPMLKW